MDFNFKTIGETASLYTGKNPVFVNLSIQQLYSLAAEVDSAIEKVEEFDRNKRFQASTCGTEKALSQVIPVFGDCLAE
jgi:hypothetical protein